MAKKPISIRETTMGEISKIMTSLKKKGLIYRCNFSQISKHFLSHFLSVKTFSVDFPTLRHAYLENISFEERNSKALQSKNEQTLLLDFEIEELAIIDKVSTNENDFHSYICKTYLNLKKEPKEELLENFENAQKDLNEIDKRLDDIESKLQLVTANNNAIEIQKEKPILYYYQEYNLKARAEIINFIKFEIQDYSLSRCYDHSLYRFFFLVTPYNYNSKIFTPKYPNDLDNKFPELTISDLRKLKELYKDDKELFYRNLANYIRDRSVVFQMQSLINGHHLLNIREDIINEVLNVYENGAKIMFVNAIPSIIEGILHDICILVGEDENELLQKGFQHKLDKLKNVLSNELYYEYYSFRFRLFRNKVAHGRLTVVDVNELSDLLLLDLFQICKLVSSTKLELNQKRFIIDTITEKQDILDYKYVLEYLILDKTIIPSFYSLEKKIVKIEDIIASDGFWNFLNNEVENSNKVIQHGIFEILRILKKRKTFDLKCENLFKKLKIKKPDNNLIENYIKNLRSYY